MYLINQLNPLSIPCVHKECVKNKKKHLGYHVCYLATNTDSSFSSLPLSIFIPVPRFLLA